MKTSLVVLALMLSGCAGVHEITADMKPVLGGCRSVELRPSAFSTQAVTVCWDERGRVIASAGSAGRAAVDVPLSVLGAGAAAISAGILGKSIKDAAGSMRLDGDIDTKHSIDFVDLPDAN